MKTFRIALGILAMLLLSLIGYINFLSPVTLQPNTLGELVYLVFGIPVLIVILWAWVEPEIIEVYFFGKELPKPDSNPMPEAIADKELARGSREN